MPVSEETLAALGALSPEDAERALRAHSGYAAQRKIESMCTMLDLFNRALADLSTAIAEFPELAGPDERAWREELENDISVRVNKELFAALGAAKTLVDYSRRLREMLNADLFDLKLKSSFDAGEHALITGLRNCVLHQVHSRANWQKRWSAGTKSTHFVIQNEDLLADGDLSSAAREHLKGLGKTCDITELMREYSVKVNLFYAWLLAEVESHLPPEVEDFRTCRRAIKRRHGQLSYEIMIGLWTQAGADPYLHLPKHLTSTQMKKLETYPHRSPQQVDFVIDCLDKDGLCDDHLRSIIYKFFVVNIPENEEAVKGKTPKS